MLDMSVEYAKQRKQYGKLIGEYQALKHQLAEVAIAPEMARPLLWAGALAIAENPGDWAACAMSPPPRVPWPTPPTCRPALPCSARRDRVHARTRPGAVADQDPRTADRVGTQSFHRGRVDTVGAGATDRAAGPPDDRPHLRDAAPAVPGVDTEEQAALRQSVASLLEKKSDSAAVRAAMNSEDGTTRHCGRRSSSRSAPPLSIPEESGGAGATWIETHLVCEELGRRLTPSPMLGSAVLSAQAVIAAGDAEACARLLPGIAAGEQVALCWAGPGGWDTPGVRADSPAGSGPVSLTGTAHHVLGADTASTLLVVAVTGDTVGLFELPADAAGVTVTRVPVMDPTRTLSRVEFACRRHARRHPGQLPVTPACRGVGGDLRRTGRRRRAAMEATVQYTKGAQAVSAA